MKIYIIWENYTDYYSPIMATTVVFSSLEKAEEVRKRLYEDYDPGKYWPSGLPVMKKSYEEWCEDTVIEEWEVI